MWERLRPTSITERGKAGGWAGASGVAGGRARLLAGPGMAIVFYFTNFHILTSDIDWPIMDARRFYSAGDAGNYNWNVGR